MSILAEALHTLHDEQLSNGEFTAAEIHAMRRLQLHTVALIVVLENFLKAAIRSNDDRIMAAIANANGQSLEDFYAAGIQDAINQGQQNFELAQRLKQVAGVEDTPMDSLITVVSAALATARDFRNRGKAKFAELEALGVI